MGGGPSKEENDHQIAVITNEGNIEIERLKQQNKVQVLQEENNLEKIRTDNKKEMAQIMAETKGKLIEAYQEKSKRDHELSKINLEKEARKDADLNEREKDRMWFQFTSDIVKVILLFIVTMTAVILTCSKLGVVQYRTERFDEWLEPENWYDSESWTYEIAEVPQKLNKWLQIESLTPDSQPLGSESDKFAESMKIERSNADPGSWTHDSEGWEHETESEVWAQESESEVWAQESEPETWSWYTHPFYWLTRNVFILAIFTLVIRWSLVLILQNI